MSELEEVSFWPGQSSYGSWNGSADGSYSRVGGAMHKEVSCRKRTVVVIAVVVCILFIIGISIPAGMLQRLKNKEEVKELPVSTDKPSTTPLKSSTAQPSPSPHSPKWSSQRLPRTLSVSEYNIKLTMKVLNDINHIPYNGTVDMLVHVANSTDLIVLHAFNINISKVEILSPSSPTDSELSGYGTYDELQQLQISLKKPLDTGSNFTLRISFSTTLRDDLHGFYRSVYTSPPNVKKAMAVTQFEATHARKAFPCFDEPDFKARFRLTITRPSQCHTLFNSPLNKTVDEGNGLETDTFEYSPKMSSYLVAIVVSELSHTQPLLIHSALNASQTIEITLYGRENQLSQLEFAKNVTAEVIKVFEQFFQVAYPLPKLDIVAIPDFENGAMENWGLITFRESALLYDPTLSSTNQQQWVTEVVAHELAHQWFGNYVTMKWWNEVWLNEGFATFVGEMIGTKTFAENQGYDWPVEENFLLSVTSAARVDSLHNSHALSRSAESVESPSVIDSMFDSISYTKGAAILRMLDSFVTRNVTQTALQDYLNAHKYGNAEASDLWASFDKAYTASGLSISEMMDSWTKTPGLPLISAVVEEDHVAVSQRPFFLCQTCNSSSGEEGRTWDVPLQYFYENKKATKTNHFYFNATKESNIMQDVEWIKLNADWTGFYLVNNTDIDLVDLKSMADVDVANMLHNSLQLIREGSLSSQSFISTLKRAMTAEQPGYLTTYMVLQSWWFILNIFDQDYVSYNEVSGAAYVWLNVSSMDVSYETLSNMTVTDRELLVSKLKMALSIDHDRVVDDNPEFHNLTVLWRRSIEWNNFSYEGIIHKDIAREVGKCSFLADEEDMWSLLWKEYSEATVPSWETDLEVILTSAKDIMLLLRMLDNCLIEEKIKQDKTISVISLITGQRRGRAVGWDFIRTNWDFLYDRHKTQISRLVSASTSTFSIHQRLQEMDEFFEKNKVGGDERAVSQAREIVLSNIFFMENRSRDILNSILEMG